MIIGISGKINSGKDTLGTIFSALLAHKGHQPEIKKFAEKIKEIVCLLIGCSLGDLEDREFKEKSLGEEWWYWEYLGNNKLEEKRVNYLDSGNRLQTYKRSGDWKLVKLTPRLLFQLLGTQCGREILHPNIWLNSLMMGYKKKYLNTPTFSEFSNTRLYSMPSWVITDVRFPNEAKAIKDRGGVIVRIDRPCVECGVYNNIACNKCSSSNLHESETALDGYEFDYRIVNDSTLGDLEYEAAKVFRKIEEKYEKGE